MVDFQTNVNIQTAIGLFILAFCLAMAIFGYLLWRFEFLDGKEFYFSENLGRILMVASVILGFATIFMLIYVQLVP